MLSVFTDISEIKEREKSLKLSWKNLMMLLK